MIKLNTNTVCGVMLALFVAFCFLIRTLFFSSSIQFDSDFGRDSLFALRIMRGQPTLLGPAASVGGFYLGPLYYYLIALVYTLGGLHPELMSIIFILMGVFAIILGYKLQTKFVSVHAGLIFLLLATASAPLVAASQFATNQPMMPLVTMLFLISYMWAITRNSAWHYFLSGVVFGLFIHVHYSAFLIYIPTLPLLLIQARGNLKHKFTCLFTFMLGTLLMASPLFLFDIRHNFITIKAGMLYIAQVLTGTAISASQPHLNLIERLTLIIKLISPNMYFSLIGICAAIWGTIKTAQNQINSYFTLLIVLSLGSLGILLAYKGYLYSYYLLVPLTVWLLLLSTAISKIKPKTLGLFISVLIFGSSLIAIPYVPKFRTLSNLKPIISVIENDITTHPDKPFTIFKDSSDQMTVNGYEYRFLLERDGFHPVFEQSYEQALVMYYIREEGKANPLISTHWESSQFGPKYSELISQVATGDRIINIYRLTK